MLGFQLPGLLFSCHEGIGFLELFLSSILCPHRSLYSHGRRILFSFSVLLIGRNPET